MKHILIVEDQPEIRHLVRMTLDAPDYQLSEAADAEAAWSAALQTPPDLVLLDIMMPGPLDGLQLCQRLKTDARTGGAKVVLVSARGHRNDIDIGRRSGADDYLVKPFSPARLLEVVEQLLADAGPAA